MENDETMEKHKFPGTYKRSCKLLLLEIDYDQY